MAGTWPCRAATARPPEETAQALAAEFGAEALGLAMDPAEVPSIRAAFAALKDRFGRLDAFVSNAANLGVGFSVLNSEESDWDAVVNANARGSFFGAQEAQRLMTEGGSIVFISSCHAKKAVPGRALYTVSKAAIGGMTRSLAVELGCLGIRVNAILAGAVRTDRWDGLSDEEVEKRRSRWPVGQESTPEQIAAAVAFLCSDAAGTISGAEIPIDSARRFPSTAESAPACSPTTRTGSRTIPTTSSTGKRKINL